MTSLAASGGGSAVGLFWGLATYKRPNTIGAQKMRLFGLMATGSWFTLCGCLVYLNDQPEFS